MKILICLGIVLVAWNFGNGQPKVIKADHQAATPVKYRPNRVRDSLEKVATDRQMAAEEKQQFVNTNMLQYYKAAYQQISNETIEESLIEVIKQKEKIIDDLNQRIRTLQEEINTNKSKDGLGVKQQPLGILQFYFPTFDFNASYEIKAQKLLDAIKFICEQRPDGKETYASIVAPEKNISSGDFQSLYKYRLQMLCLLINNK